MDKLNLLKQFKNVMPDPVWSARSRASILAHEPKAVLPRFAPWGIFMNALQSGSAIALTGALLFLLIGGFSIARFLETAGGLDPYSLRAEAEAIDIQIQLAQLAYDAPAAEVKAGELDPKETPSFRTTSTNVEVTTTTPKDEATSTPVNTEPTIVDALEALVE